MKIKRMAIGSVLGVIATLAIAGFAWAADCGGVLGSTGGKVPCSCGDTVVTNTTLISPSADPVNGDPVVSTADADFCGADGLLMAPPNTDRMTLNLGGNAIRGSGSGVGLRIIGNGVRVSIRNGTLRNFETGLTNTGGVNPTGDARIREIAAIQNVTGIDLEGNDHEVDTNQALDNTQTGIRVEGNSNKLLFNQVSRSGNNGIEVIGNQNRLATNRLNRNIGSGIVVDGDNNILDHNTTENNSIDGIQLLGNGDGDPATLEIAKNKSVKNRRNGITIEGNDLEIVANQGNTNGEDGISVVGTGNHIDTNIMRENKGDGLIAPGLGNFDDGGNLGKKNGAVQCQINGVACKP